MEEQLDKTRKNVAFVEEDVKRLKRAYEALEKRLTEEGNEELNKLRQAIAKLSEDIKAEKAKQDAEMADLRLQISTKEQTIKNGEKLLEQAQAVMGEKANSLASQYTQTDRALEQAKTVIQVLHDRLLEGVNEMKRFS